MGQLKVSTRLVLNKILGFLVLDLLSDLDDWGLDFENVLIRCVTSIIPDSFRIPRGFQNKESGVSWYSTLLQIQLRPAKSFRCLNFFVSSLFFKVVSCGWITGVGLKGICVFQNMGWTFNSHLKYSNYVYMNTMTVRKNLIDNHQGSLL